jgi:hypothetical protein
MRSCSVPQKKGAENSGRGTARARSSLQAIVAFGKVGGSCGKHSAESHPRF